MKYKIIKEVLSSSFIDELIRECDNFLYIENNENDEEITLIQYHNNKYIEVSNVFTGERYFKIKLV